MPVSTEIFLWLTEAKARLHIFVNITQGIQEVIKRLLLGGKT